MLKSNVIILQRKLIFMSYYSGIGAFSGTEVQE